MTIHRKEDGLIVLTMKESELDELHTAIGMRPCLESWCTLIDQLYETYYR